MASTMPGSNPPVNRAEIDTPVTEPMVISTMEGGIVSVCAPVAAKSATRSPGLAPRSSIWENTQGGDPRHVGCFRARDAGDEIHGSDEHVVEAAAHVAEERGQEAH